MELINKMYQSYEVIYKRDPWITEVRLYTLKNFNKKVIKVLICLRKK